MSELLAPPRAPEVKSPAPSRMPGLFDRILACSFIIGVCLPLVGTFFHWDFSSGITERRTLASFPPMPHTLSDATTFPDRFMTAYSDHFGYRKGLIHTLQDFRFHAGFLTHADMVLVGKDGWLYVRQRANNLNYANERGFESFSQAQLDQWQILLETRTAYLKNRGIAYVVTIAPDKYEIYPQHLPDDLAPIRPSRLDQLAARLANTHSPVNFVDMRPALRAAAGSELVYRTTDSHWNFAGAYVGYREILAGVARALPQYTFTPQPRSNFDISVGPNRPGELVSLLGLDNQLTEPWVAWVRRENLPMTTTLPRQYDLHEPTRPRLLMLDDSFTNLLFTMLAPHFDHSLFMFTDPIDIPLVDAQKPDIIISEMVERKLFLAPPWDPPEVRNTPVPHP